MKNQFDLPNDLFEFVIEHGNKEIDLSGSNNEVEIIKVFNPEELKEYFTILNTHEYHLNYGEFDEDPEISFWIPSMDLIKEDCEDNFFSEGLLIWFPFLNCFGTSDTDHQLVYVFPETPWEKIHNQLGNYINTQWYPDKTENTLLMPWKEQGLNISFDQFIKKEN